MSMKNRVKFGLIDLAPEQFIWENNSLASNGARIETGDEN
jgi:hypothetical protein